jgi:hypothetical protein
MKLFVVITIARQIEGEYVFIKTEKYFKRASDADKLVQHLRGQYTTPEGKIVPQKISTPTGEADCGCTVGAFEVESGDEVLGDETSQLKENNG